MISLMRVKSLNITVWRYINKQQRTMVVKLSTSSHSNYRSILPIPRRCTAPFYHTSKMVFILLHLHSFNKYLSNAYSVHVPDLGHTEQESCRMCPPRAHILTERADTQLIIQLFDEAGVTQWRTQVFREHITQNPSHAFFYTQNQLS